MDGITVMCGAQITHHHTTTHRSEKVRLREGLCLLVSGFRKSRRLTGFASRTRLAYGLERSSAPLRAAPHKKVSPSVNMNLRGRCVMTCESQTHIVRVRVRVRGSGDEQRDRRTVVRPHPDGGDHGLGGHEG